MSATTYRTPLLATGLVLVGLLSLVALRPAPQIAEAWQMTPRPSFGGRQGDPPNDQRLPGRGVQGRTRWRHGLLVTGRGLHRTRLATTRSKEQISNALAKVLPEHRSKKLCRESSWNPSFSAPRSCSGAQHS